MRACNNLPQPNPYIHLSFWGLQKIVACFHSFLQCLFVSTVFGTVSSLHSIILHFYTCIPCSARQNCMLNPAVHAHACHGITMASPIITCIIATNPEHITWCAGLGLITLNCRNIIITMYRCVHMMCINQETSDYCLR